MSKPAASMQPIEFGVFYLSLGQLKAIQTLKDVQVRVSMLALRLHLGVLKEVGYKDMPLVVCDTDLSGQVARKARFIRLMSQDAKIEEGTVQALPPQLFFMGLSLEEANRRAVQLMEALRLKTVDEPQ